MSDIVEKMQDVWKAEQEILDVIDQVCRKNKLRYSLAYGTLIGAVRHGGFIPWDDDIDLVMPRGDYEKLLQIWNQQAPAGYLLQNTRTDSDFTQVFSKIRKDHTTFLQTEEEGKKHYHKGVFVDIFPLDRVAPGKMSRKLQYIESAVYLLYTRGFTSGSRGFVGIAEKILICVPEKLRFKLRRRLDRAIQHWNSDTEAQWFCPSVIGSVTKYYKPNLWDDVSEIPFCGKMYGCVRDWDSMLRCDYGDYMQLPPEEDRVWKHHPILIDFEHNYEELTN